MCFTSWLIGIHLISCEINKFYGVSDRDWKCAHIFISLCISIINHIEWFESILWNWNGAGKSAVRVFVCFLFQFQLFNVPASFISRAQYIQSGGQTVFSVQQTLVWNSIVLGHSTGSFLVVLHAAVCVCVYATRIARTHWRFFLFLIKALKTSKHHKTR